MLDRPPAQPGGDVRPHSLPDGFQAVALTAEQFWRHPVSSTFHGRDIFAPVAAHLSSGVALEELGPSIDSLLLFPVPRARRERDGSVTGEVLAVDRFENRATYMWRYPVGVSLG